MRELPYKVSELAGWAEGRGLSPGRPTQPDPAGLAGSVTFLDQIKSLPDKGHIVVLHLPLGITEVVFLRMSDLPRQINAQIKLKYKYED